MLLAGVLPICFRQVSVSDAWWHMALGKWLVEKRSLPDLAQFYFTAADAGSLASELRWTWLGDILLYALFAALGSPGLQLLSVACMIAALAFLARISGRPRGPWTILLLVAVAFGTYQLLPRNAVFSLALYPAVLWLVLRKKEPPRAVGFLLSVVRWRTGSLRAVFVILEVSAPTRNGFSTEAWTAADGSAFAGLRRFLEESRPAR